MTEQEKREKAIEEMNTEIEIQCNSHSAGSYNCKTRFCRECEKGLLYDAGYRKEEEVRKETARDIQDMIKKEIMCNLATHINYCSAESNEKKYARIITNQLLYCINLRFNERYGFTNQLNACNQLICEKELAKEFGVEVEE